MADAMRRSSKALDTTGDTRSSHGQLTEFRTQHDAEPGWCVVAGSRSCRATRWRSDPNTLPANASSTTWWPSGDQALHRAARSARSEMTTFLPQSETRGRGLWRPAPSVVRPHSDRRCPQLVRRRANCRRAVDRSLRSAGHGERCHWPPMRFDDPLRVRGSCG